MAPFHAIRVLIRHADPVAHAGMAAAFSRHDDLCVLDEAGDTLSHHLADVVVADHEHALALLRSGDVGPASRAKVLVVGAGCREWEIRSALESGVRGYVLGGCGIDELVTAVRAVDRGQRYVSPPIAPRIAEIVAGEALTAREEQVLRLLVEGLGNKAIALRLDIAVGTVKSHLKNVFDKLEVQSRTQAIRAAERRGLLRELPDRGQPTVHLGRGHREMPRPGLAGAFL